MTSKLSIDGKVTLDVPNFILEFYGLHHMIQGTNKTVFERAEIKQSAIVDTEYEVVDDV